MADHLFYFKDSNKYLKLPNFDKGTADHEAFLKIFKKNKIDGVIDV